MVQINPGLRKEPKLKSSKEMVDTAINVAEEMKAHRLMVDYSKLQAVLDKAYERAAHTKGRERHAGDRNFEDQPIITITRMVGHGFTRGQAIKKIEEAGRLGKEEAINEILDAIVYLAADVVVLSDT